MYAFASSLDHILDIVLQTIREFVPFSGGSIALIDVQRRLYVAASTADKISFHNLVPGSMSRISMVPTDPPTGKAVRRELSERLLLALEAGQAAGGDKRGKQSAALLVASPEPRMHHNLRVDDHADPVTELRRVWEVVVEHGRRIEREYGAAAVRLFGRVKH